MSGKGVVEVKNSSSSSSKKWFQDVTSGDWSE